MEICCKFQKHFWIASLTQTSKSVLLQFWDLKALVNQLY